MLGFLLGLVVVVIIVVVVVVVIVVIVGVIYWVLVFLGFVVVVCSWKGVSLFVSFFLCLFCWFPFN